MLADEVAYQRARAWVRGEVTMTQARTAAGHAMAAARDLRGAERHAAYRLTVRATDGAGNRLAARRAAFRIVR